MHIVLCKPKVGSLLTNRIEIQVRVHSQDDLRKDARLMEFNGLINKCLRKDAEARRRALYIRTYSVMPLNEECGILEWVNNVHGLRNILLKIYRERGLYTAGSELKQMQLLPNASIEYVKKKKEEYLLDFLYTTGRSCPSSGTSCLFVTLRFSVNGFCALSQIPHHGTLCCGFYTCI